MILLTSRSCPARRMRLEATILLCLGLPMLSGCWAPLRSCAIPATTLPDSYRIPMRTSGPPLNFSMLTIPPQPDYILGSGDVLEVTVRDLYPGSEVRPVRAQIMSNGEIHLPQVGAVRIGGLNLSQANAVITKAYAAGFIVDPRTNVFLVQKQMTSVLVLGEVGAPGIYELPKYENDVAHALAAAGGLRDDAAMEIQVHRRGNPGQTTTQTTGQKTNPTRTPSTDRVAPDIRSGSVLPVQWDEPISDEVLAQDPSHIFKIPLRGYMAEPLTVDDIVLGPGDVIVVPSRKDEVFYVVGKLSPTNFVRFNIGARERDIGAGFLLPRDREIDVVTAVAMAGYIDPIDSPTTVTVHRTGPNGQPVLIGVDLIRARYDRRETILIEPGDIVYLNPDFGWWSRRTLDRIIPSLFSTSYKFN